MRMTLPNKITLTRAALAIIMFLLMITGNPWALVVSSLVFGVAAGTDWIDGRIARQTNTYTPFGAIVDPFVDKILVGAAFFAFIALRLAAVGMGMRQPHGHVFRCRNIQNGS